MEISAKKIEKAMVKMGIKTFGELAEKAKLSRQSITMIRQRASCSLASAVKLANALNLDISAIESDERSVV